MVTKRIHVLRNRFIYDTWDLFFFIIERKIDNFTALGFLAGDLDGQSLACPVVHPLESYAGAHRAGAVVNCERQGGKSGYSGRLRFR
jgi:hypothetical protein